MPLPLNIDLTDVVRNLARDVGLSSNDVFYVLSRLKCEGIRFLTSTLPQLSKSVLKGLEKGYFERPTCIAWKGRSLRYFRSLLDGIFCPVTGRLQSNPDAVSVWGIRQFCEYLYKLALEFESAELSEAEAKFVKTEQDVRSTSFDNRWVDRLRKNAETFYPSLSRAEVHHVFQSARPRFGPGSFSGSSTIRRSCGVHWAVYKHLPIDRIGSHTAPYEAFSGYFKSYPSSPERVRVVEEKRQSEVLFVPKDSRGPRVISREPLFALKGQMGFFDYAVSALQKDTCGRIQFLSQERQRELARVASMTQEYATLDLKEASDRVSFALTKRVFENFPAIRWFLRNSRTSVAILPSGRKLTLAKLAGMGSGLTFPIMAMLIHLSICSQVQLETGFSYKSIMRAVSVYGDDVIVPTQWYNIAVRGLCRSALLVNEDKSFWQGHFRESCGGDFFKGNDVAPVRLKLTGADLKTPSTYRAGVIRVSTDNGLLQLSRHTRELWSSGMLCLKAYYDKKLSKSFGGCYPDVSGDSPFIGRYTDSLNVSDEPKKAYSSRCVTIHEGGASPYKFLASSFKRGEDSVGQPFAEIAIPRKITLKCKLASGVALRSVPLS